MPPPSRARLLLGLAAAILLATVLLLSIGEANSISAEFTRIAHRLAAQGPSGELLFVAVLAAVCVVGIVPASSMAIAAGGVYGLGMGVLLGAIGISAGGVAGFVLARTLFRDLARPWVERHLSLRAIEADIAEEGWRLVVLLRLSPIAPFGITSYALGLTRLRFTDYLIGTLGSIPALAAYVYVGVVARHALHPADERAISWLKLGILGVGVLATLVAGIHIYKVLRGGAVKTRDYRAL